MVTSKLDDGSTAHFKSGVWFTEAGQPLHGIMKTIQTFIICYAYKIKGVLYV